MKTETDYKSSPLYPRALAHAGRVLSMPLEDIKAKLKDRLNWKEDRLPAQEELAVYILQWVDAENIRLRRK